MNRDAPQHPQTLNLYQVTLKEGLPVLREGKTIKYKTVRLCEVSVVDERWAVRQAERLVLWQGEPRLVVSAEDHKLALTVRHIEAFECDGMELGKDVIDMALIDKLKPVDLALIEDRVFLLEMSLKVRYGELTQAQFDQLVNGPAKETTAPQPVGPTADAGENPAHAGSGPVMLADHVGQGAGGVADGLGGRTGSAAG